MSDISGTSKRGASGLSYGRNESSPTVERWGTRGSGDNPHLLFNPNIILNLGASYLRWLYDNNYTGNWNNDWRFALAIYHGGAANPNYDYADYILNLANQYKPE